jgi:hypothetical protein
MLALLVWKGMKTVGRLSQQGWAAILGRRGTSARREQAEHRATET